MQPESRSILFAIAAASVIAPLIGRVLTRYFPPAATPIHTLALHRWRYRLIEHGGVICGLIGISLAFLWRGSSAVEATALNVTVLLSAMLVSMIGGVALLSVMFADRGTDGFLNYFESEYRVSARVVSTVARGLFVVSSLALISAVRWL